jgi:hypothetical protein
VNDTYTHAESAEPTADDYNRLESFRRRGVEPNAPAYVTLDDVLLVQSWAPLATTVFRVAIRMLSPRGEIVPVAFQFSALAQGLTPTSSLIRNLEGFILSLSVDTAAGQIGACYVSIQIQRGVGSGDVTRGQVLVQGYPSLHNALGYPQQSPVSPLDQRGLVNVVTFANPGAGAEYDITVPAGVNWLFRAFRCQLATAAGGGNRQPTLRITDAAANIAAEVTSGGSQAGSLTFPYTWAPGISNVTPGNLNDAGFVAEARLPGGFHLRTFTYNIAAGDQYSLAALLVETFVGQ